MRKRILDFFFLGNDIIGVGITADTTLYKADTTLITADNG